MACAALVAGLGHSSTAQASAPHVVVPGETLWSISAANNLTTRTVAVFNGIAEDAQVVEGQTIQVPTVDEGAVALANAGISPVAGPAATDPAAVVPAATGASHTVVMGESLSSVAAANGVSITDLAAANGMAPEAFLIEGTTISVPAPSASTAGMGHIPSPSGELHLDPVAADSWNAMRGDSLNNFGVDLYPGGPASAYRTPEQQQELYDLYLSGQGAPANPPGSSTHELGNAVDLADPVMRDVVDQIGSAYGWMATIPSEWWHVEHGG
ncbi:MAG: LysM peptidoglycan-binding domain-containing protein [Actinomycetota bacterium]|nr:LysM peptidoglycan-binding domain-containing protein [Actinomycetota bacterium]